jgi:carboxymethylenebutenolidase
VTSTDITISTCDGPMPTFSVAPLGPPKGGLIVIQEAFGVTNYIRGVTQRLAESGWSTITPALFHRQGSPVLPYDNFEAVMPFMSQLTAEGITADLAASFGHLESQGFSDSEMGIVGFCMGGSVSFYAGTLRPLAAAVTFYGGGVGEGRFGLPALVKQARFLQAPWLGLYGDLDHTISVDEVERLRQAASTAAVETEIIRYADADHGFHCHDRPAVYNSEAAGDAWERMLNWFDLHVSPRRGTAR